MFHYINLVLHAMNDKHQRSLCEDKDRPPGGITSVSLQKKSTVEPESKSENTGDERSTEKHSTDERRVIVCPLSRGYLVLTDTALRRLGRLRSKSEDEK